MLFDFYKGITLIEKSSHSHSQKQKKNSPLRIPSSKIRASRSAVTILSLKDSIGLAHCKGAISTREDLEEEVAGGVEEPLEEEGSVEEGGTCAARLRREEEV